MWVICKAIEVYKDMYFLRGTRNRIEILTMAMEVALMLREVYSTNRMVKVETPVADKGAE